MVLKGGGWCGVVVEIGGGWCVGTWDGDAAPSAFILGPASLKRVECGWSGR